MSDPSTTAPRSPAGDAVGGLAVALFSLIVEDDASLRVGFRVIASWPRLARDSCRGRLSP